MKTTFHKCSTFTFVRCTRTRTLLEDDRFSGIPYDVLSKILSHLTMKEAVRTSILSPSWKDLWKTYSGFLDFDPPPNLLSLIEYDPEREYDSQLHFDAICRYTSWVDKLLDSHQSPTIQGLRIAFELNNTFSHHIDRWIEFAIFNKVETLVLDLAPPCRKPGDDDEYVFPARFLYAPIGGFHAFDRLTCLELRFLAVPEEVTQYIFGNCHLLQSLCLEEVFNIKNLRLDNSLPELKHLEITRCRFLENVYVSARRLTSFRYVSSKFTKTDVVFGDVPQLSTLVLGGRHYKVVLDNLPFNLSQLDSVSLLDSVSFFYYPIDECLWSRPWPCMIPNATLGRFQELKHLELNLERFLGDRIECTGAFLQASTCLEKLVIKLTWINPAQAQEERLDALSRHRHLEHVVMGFEHKCLKEVVYVGWLGLDAEVEIVQLLIESARSSLERITINLGHSHNNKDAVKLETRWEKDNAKARAMQLQQKLVSSNAKLLVN